MAKFEMELPTELIKELEGLEKNTDKALAEMTQAGAEYVANKLMNTAPTVLKNHIKMTKPYKTPTDGGINTKVYFSGYIPFSDANRKYFQRKGGSGKTYYATEGVPADFLAQLYEYGRSTSPFPKKPFVRKAFKDKGITEAMVRSPRVKFYKDLWGESDFVNDWISGGYGGK